MKTEAPLVSILIPAYNAEPWIRHAIESALTQTYSPIEVIVVDDGSTDGTADVIRSFGDRIRFVQVAHAGGNSARNVLLEVAQGEWLQYLDADDYLLPSRVADQMRYVERNDSEFDVVYSPFLLRHEASKTEALKRPAVERDLTEHFISWGVLWTGALFFRRAAVIDVGGWKEDQPCCQEHEFLLRSIKAEKRFGLSSEAGAVYREHGPETVSRKSPLRTIQTRMGLTDQFVELVKGRRALTPDHLRALYVARMEAARGAWPFDRSYARELARKALTSGRWWKTGSPALPLRFQVAFWLFGFEGAQRIAGLSRSEPNSRQIHG